MPGDGGDLDAALVAGAASSARERLAGSVEAGKIANLIVTDGDKT